MIDASSGFMKDGAKNRLRSQDIHKVVDVFTRQTEVERYSRMVPLSEIAEPENDFNLNIPRYIDSSGPEDIQDLDAHLYGGIPERDIDALSDYWDAFPRLRSQLFKPNRPGYLDLAVEVADVQQAILDSLEFQEFVDEARALINEWFAAHRKGFASIGKKTKPGDLIGEIGDDLLRRFKPVALLDEYDVYERLMTYWHSVMHDDVFLAMHDGWIDAAMPRLAIDNKDRKLSEDPDLAIGSGGKATKYKIDLVPPDLIVARYFGDEQAQVDDLNLKAVNATQAIEEYVEEHSADEGLLTDAMDDNGKLTQKAAKAGLAEAKAVEDEEAVECFQQALDLLKAETAAKKVAKEAQVSLDKDTLNKYGDLAGKDIKQLVLEDKWIATIRDLIADEADALTLTLVTRTRQLGERYAKTVGDLDVEIKRVDATVEQHLLEMGLAVKKQAINQGMVQHLLTGKVRLPSFSGKWRFQRLSELLAYEQPGRYLVATSAHLKSGRYPVLTAGKTFVLGYTNETEGVYRGWPAIIFDDFTTSAKYVDFDFKVKSSAIKILTPRSDVNLRFMYELMQVLDFQLGDHKRYWISEYGQQMVQVPERAEQDAIASVLADADTEVNLRRQRLAKAEAVKQGMMQELLTGRIRLPVGRPRRERRRQIERRAQNRVVELFRERSATTILATGRTGRELQCRGRSSRRISKARGYGDGSHQQAIYQLKNEPRSAGAAIYTRRTRTSTTSCATA